MKPDQERVQEPTWSFGEWENGGYIVAESMLRKLPIPILTRRPSTPASDFRRTGTSREDALLAYLMVIVLDLA